MYSRLINNNNRLKRFPDLKKEKEKNKNPVNDFPETYIMILNSPFFFLSFKLLW